FKWLLVFDNADEPERIVKYWPPVSAGSIIVTSRAPMLDMNLTTARCEVELLTNEEGAEMLLSILDLDTQPAAPDLAKTIAANLDGIPLAISQMAGFMRKTRMPMERFLAMYRNKEHAAKLNSENTSIDHYQYRHTLESVWLMSYERLSPEAYVLLCLVAFFFPDHIPEELFLVSPSEGSPEKHQRESSTALVVFDDEI
ncbi:hypothetical protein IL306_001774, partial [Fusarium sp. DS 682]